MAEQFTRRHDLLTLAAIGVAAHIAADVMKRRGEAVPQCRHKSNDA
jgi:hypothetical protein